MEKLIIHNFLTIRSAEIEVRRFNLFIGPQASGKSVIVKLLYFFKEEVSNALQENIRLMQGKRELHSTLNAKFEEIFPRIYWNNQEFKITYSFGELTTVIKTEKKRGTSLAWSITCSDILYSFQVKIKRLYKSALEDAKSKPDDDANMIFNDERYIFVNLFTDFISKNKYSDNFEEQIFIPASRTFFASLQKNIFSFLASNIEIDYFLKEFGSTYERAKLFHSHEFFRKQMVRKELISIMDGIISGRYLYEDRQDWIVSTSGRTNLANASSGQQESLPMLLVLCTIPLLYSERKAGFFIEEPEAHLFPVSQKAVISLLALITNKTQHQFFITTHSPYLLTALNNCIIAHETYAAADEAGKQKVLEIMPEHQHIAFADVAAWTVTEKGTIESILDQEAQIIGASILDGVSQHFETVTNELLDIRYYGQSL